MRAQEFILEDYRDTAAIYSVSSALSHRLGLDNETSYKRLARRVKYMPGLLHLYKVSDLIDIQPLNRSQTRELYDTLSTMRIFLTRLPSQNGYAYRGAFFPDYNAVAINTWVDWNDFRVPWGSIIAHEVQHALDHTKSQGKNINVGQRDLSDHEQYLAAPWEVNARMQQVLREVYDFMIKLVAVHGDEGLDLLKNSSVQKKLMSMSQSSMELHNLPEVFPRGLADPAYQRLVNRVYKLISSPMFVYNVQAKPNSLQRLSQWFTNTLFKTSGKSTNAST